MGTDALAGSTVIGGGVGAFGAGLGLVTFGDAVGDGVGDGTVCAAATGHRNDTKKTATPSPRMTGSASLSNVGFVADSRSQQRLITDVWKEHGDQIALGALDRTEAELGVMHHF
jgi:hypothetical protein